MTREEAIKELKESLETLREYDIANSSRLKQALEMAIRTLENHDIFMKRSYSQGKQDALSQEPSGEYKVLEQILFYLDSREKVANDEWVSFEFKELQKFIRECLKEYKVEGSDKKE